jgi:putative membrane protein
MQPAFREKMVRFLQGWLINTLGVCVAALLPGIHAENWQAMVLAALLLGLLNGFVRPFLVLVALPLLVFTLGLFMLVINAALLAFVGNGKIVHGFVVDSFGWAIVGSLIISTVSIVLNVASGSGKSRVRVGRFGRRQQGPDRRDDGGGPVIDV